MTDAKITIEPRVALFDDVVEIEVCNLASKQKVTLRSMLVSESKDVFHCVVHYNADEWGVVKVKTHAAIGGMYSGVEPMGLFWAMEDSKLFNRRRSIRLFKKDVTKPYIVTISVYDGHIYDESILNSAKPIGKVEAERWHLSNKVKRVPVRSGRIRGTMFIPDGSGPFPGILNVEGMAGGIREHRSALLASKGFVTLIIAYFGFDDLPKALDICDLEYFEEAARFLHSHPMVSTERGIGAIGSSYGCLPLQTLSTIISDIISCMVSVSSPHIGHSVPIRYKEKTWEAMKANWQGIAIEKRAVVLKDSYLWPVNSHDDPRWAIDLSKFKGDLLLISGDADETFYSSWWSEKARKMMENGGKTNYEIIKYPNAGHLIEPPYSPYCVSFFNGFSQKILLAGGAKRANAFANEDAWRRCVEFLKKHFRAPKSNL